MTVLDDAFGPKEPPPDIGPRVTHDEMLLRAMQGGSRWKCEERIRLTLDAFFECWPELLPRSPYMRQTHYPPARNVVDELGELEAPVFLRWAYTVVSHESPGLTIKNARSLLFLVGRWRAREVGPEWYRKPCPKCCTFHPPGPKCPEEMEEEDD